MEKDIAKLADILGHSSIDTTRIYIMSTGAEHRRRMERLAIVTMLIDDTVSAAVRIHLGYIQKDAVSEDDIFYSAFSLLLRKIDPLIGISCAANLTPAEGSPR